MKKSRLVMALLCLPIFGLTSCAPKGVYDCNRVMSDLSRKTYVDQCVGYTLRYHTDDWDLKPVANESIINLHSTFSWPPIKVTIWCNSDEKNLAQEIFEERFKDLVSSLFEKNQFKEEKTSLTINDIDFVKQEATAEFGKHDRRIFQFANGSEKGSVALVIIGPKNFYEESKEKVDTLLQGFSFDGEACKGPSGLRKAKSIFDNLCDRGIIEMH